ncbi:T9SS type A sorting domain-containing protein [Polluticoccus soli]|uniref:T9SS type A sorting domain-containing protein n=1 Tax=Polluticoccus soli TaxID=3034150 RepID=UPI0023E1469F|nr:T9SS type A sorting domain-containing protein [Flavipsychrobacter sp. JY13-12]
MKELLRIAIFLLLPVISTGQTYYNLTHDYGTQIVGTNPVTVSDTGSAEAPGLVCFNVGPYSLGKNGKLQLFRYEFGYPVKGIRIQVAYVGDKDTLALYINDNFYPLTSSNISPNVSTFCQGYTTLCQVYNGLLGPDPGTGGGAYPYSKAQLDINPTTLINNVMLSYRGNGNGFNYSIWYAIDPHVYLKEPFYDTIACAGDTIQVGMKVSDNFNAGNTFKVQLSDANGNFANGTIIGSRQSDTAGTILCGIPDMLPEGTNYHFRIISTLPADTSTGNTYPIRVAHYPTLAVSSNSPICAGDVLRLNAVTDNTNLKWTGPGGFSATVANPSFISEMKYIGEYEVTTDNYGCITTVSTNVTIKPLPVITSINNTSPKCENEEIVLQVKASDTATKFSWTGPGGFTSNVPSPKLSDVRISSNGLYSVIANLNGCISTADSTSVTIYPRPEKPVISVNNPVKPGDSLVFRAAGVPGASYQWTGPGGFSSTEQNPIKTLVDVTDEGEYKVTSTMGSCSSSTSVVIDVLQAALSYYLTPNPGNGDIRIYGNYLVSKTIPFEVVTSTGQTLYRGQVTTNKKFLDIKLDMHGQLSNGVYFIRLQLKDEMLKIPFVIGQ